MKSTISGLDDVVASIRRFPASLATRSAYEEVASEFAARLRAATPPGYNRRLQDSVLVEVSDTSARVGYDADIETAGRQELDRVTGPPRTRGRSVLRRWIRPDELETVLGDVVDSYLPDVPAAISKGLR